MKQSADGSTIPVLSMLARVVEGYLLGDLDSMATEIVPKEMGAVGYPMVMAVLSGSELLGALTSKEAPANRIGHYWEEYMAKVCDRYSYLGDVAYEMARCGIAHSYLSHLGVVVQRGGPYQHLSRYGDEVVFDCLNLYADFRLSYEEHARAYIIDHLEDAQKRLNNLVRHDLVNARSRINALPTDRFPNKLGPGATGSIGSRG